MLFWKHSASRLHSLNLGWSNLFPNSLFLSIFQPLEKKQHGPAMMQSDPLQQSVSKCASWGEVGHGYGDGVIWVCHQMLRGLTSLVWHHIDYPCSKGCGFNVGVILSTDLMQVNILLTWKHTHALISSVVVRSGSDKGGPIITAMDWPLV